MKPIVLALASNERYVPGLYSAVASALNHLDAAREVYLKVLDSGLSQTSKNILSRLAGRFGNSVRLEFMAVDVSIFRSATLGPGRSHITYSRLLLPHLLHVPRVIYLDCDVLVFRDLSQLFDLELAPGKVLAAARDSETLSLADDSPTIADAINLPREGAYFNCGVTLLNLDALREQHFFHRSVEFLNRWRGHYRFYDQSAINFLLHDQIDELPEYWNRVYWRFDAQQNNDLDCVLHYTTSAPWLGGTRGPAQVLFERFAADAGLPVNRRSPAVRTSVCRVWRNAIAPLRALAFPIAWLWYRLIGKTDKSAAYGKVARYWFDYVYNTPNRRRLYGQRSREISTMKFDFAHRHWLHERDFLRAQVGYLFRSLPYRYTWRHKLSTLVEAVDLLVGYIRLKLTLRFSTRAAPISGKTCVVVLLTHNRPQNMSFLVQAILRNRFVTRVIVSNSNPRVKINDWIALKDSRLVLVDEISPTQPGHRLVLARQSGAEYVISIDDDIFLTPKQFGKFFEFLLADEQCPHGIIGHDYRAGTQSSNGSPFHHLTGRDTEVDVLIGAYAFTSEHLKRVFDLAANIGVSDLSRVRNGEDILLSFSGTTRPHIHPLKPALSCASEGLPGVALWKSDHDFWGERVRLFEKVRDARLTMKTMWADEKLVQ